MIHPQPTSFLLQQSHQPQRARPAGGHRPLLTLLAALRRVRRLRPAEPATAGAAALAPVEVAAAPAAVPRMHSSGHSPRLRSGLGGRLSRARRRTAVRSARRRGDLHVPGRRADRRGL